MKETSGLSKKRRPAYDFIPQADRRNCRSRDQANVLGAAILMPQKEIDNAMRQFACGRVLKNYEGRFSYIDRLSLTLLCQSLGVSKSAAIIRLRQLGYIEDCPYAEYDDPLEVWP